IRATLLHIRDAENTWWGRITGNSTTWPASTDRSIGSLLPINELFHGMVLALDEDRLRELVTYHDLKGNAHMQPAWQLILHCLNHSTQHRGQLISQMRALGMEDIPANDLVVHQRSFTIH
ncbi:MAG: DinB family protein, partial [Flavobacteriales bacterium]